MDKRLGLAPIKVEDLRSNPELRDRMKREAATGSHPKPDVIRVIEELENRGH